MATRRRPARGRNAAPPPRSAAVPVALASFGFPVGVVACALGYPGVAIWWLFVVVAAFSSQAPELTGAKEKGTNRILPAHEGEEKLLARHRFWDDLKFSVLLPFGLLGVGIPPYASWVFGLLAAAAASALPQTYPHAAAANAAAALLLVTGWAETRRKTIVSGDRSPGLRINPVGLLAAARDCGWLASVAALLTTAAPGALGALLGTRIPAPSWSLAFESWLADGATGGLPSSVSSALAPVLTASAPVLTHLAEHLWVYVAGAVGAGLGALPWWIRYTLGPWREVVAARAEWDPIWVALKHEFKPRLVAVEQVGAATVLTFDAAREYGAVKYWPLAPNLAPLVGAGKQIAVLATPDLVNGQPRVGTEHPIRFQIVLYDAGQTPDISDPMTPQAEVELLLNCAMAWSCDAAAMPRMYLESLESVAQVDVEAIERARRRPSPLDYLRSAAQGVTRVGTATSAATTGATQRLVGPLLRVLLRVARVVGRVSASAARLVHRVTVGAWRELRARRAEAAERRRRAGLSVEEANEELLVDLFDLDLDGPGAPPADGEESAAAVAPPERYVPAARDAGRRTLRALRRPADEQSQPPDPTAHPTAHPVGAGAVTAPTPAAPTPAAPPPAPSGEPGAGDTGGPEEEAEEVVYSARQAFRADWVCFNGTDLLALRLSLRGALAGHLGCDVLVEHSGANPACYVGALLTDEVVIDRSKGIDEPTLADINDADMWNERWSEALKLGVNPPIIQSPVYAEAELANGTVVHRQPFLARRGQDVAAEYFHQEKKLATALDAAPFVAITGWHMGRGGVPLRPGERHPMAFSVYWSRDQVPANPDALAPVTKTAASPTDRLGPQWVLAGRMNEAFRAAKLPKPEVASATCLTSPRSEGHIWEMHIRLYDGATLGIVRSQAEALRQALGSQWLRVTEATDGCKIVAGVKLGPRVRLVHPEKGRHYLASLDWEQAWLDSKVSGVGGRTPTLRASAKLPTNEDVSVLDFDLPPGLSVGDVRAATDKLKTATANAFVDVRESPEGRADQVRLLVSEMNPLPDSVPFDFEACDAADGIAFATGVEGEPIVFDPLTSPHALLAGVTGAGKSVLAQNFLYGFLVTGAEVYIVDPVKGGADFQFAKPFAKAIVGESFAAAGLMKLVYAEVVRRKNLNAQYGVGSYRELPEPPPPIVIFIDEFTSLMSQSPVPKQSDDPDIERERALLIAENQARTEIGVLSGKLAREARSAGVTVLLATQKLTAKMLDGIPGGQDLKDLSLDTRLPVPVSERFPSGWATVGALVEGDLLYAPDGSTTRIVGFSEVFTDNELYEVTFDDGQVVKAGADHGWLACRSDGDLRVIRTAEMATDAAHWMIPMSAPVGGFAETMLVAPDPEGAVLAAKCLSSGELIDPAALRQPMIQRLAILRALAASATRVSDSRVELDCGAAAGQVVELARSMGLKASSCGSLATWRPANAHHITSIRRIPNEPTRCIAVDHPSHLFLVEGFIPTHNTNLARVLLGKASYGDRASALRSFDSAPMLDGNIPKGRGLWEPLTSSAVIVQTWFAPQAELGAQLAQRVRPLEPHELVDLSAFTAPELEVEGQILDGASIEPFRPSPPGGGTVEPEVVELGTVSFSLDDLEDLAEDTETEDTAVEEDTQAAGDTGAAEVTGAGAGVGYADHPLEPPLGPPLDELADVPVVEAVDEPVERLRAGGQSDGPGASPEVFTEVFRGLASPEPVGPVEPEAEEIEIDEVCTWHEVDPTDWAPERSMHGWVEIDALLGFLDDYPEVHTVLWVDPKLDEVAPVGLRFADLVSSLLAQRNVAFNPDQSAPEATAGTGATGELTATEQAPAEDFFGVLPDLSTLVTAPTAPTAPAGHSPVQRPVQPPAQQPPAAPPAPHPAQSAGWDDSDPFDNRRQVPAHLIPTEDPFA